MNRRRTLTQVIRGARTRVDRLHARAAPEEMRRELAAARVTLRRAAALEQIDVTAHNGGTAPPDFGTVQSQVVSFAQFDHPDLQAFAQLLTGCETPLPWSKHSWPAGRVERKLWEWCYILKAAEAHGKLRRGVAAAGFGVGQEPLPAALARHGVSVLATDLPSGERTEWAETGQRMHGLESLSRPHIVDDAELARLVRTQAVDMTDLPNDLGTFDLIWSSCALEHLGSPEAGLEFVERTADRLNPGGLAVHTTELELTRRATTADYGHLAVYRLDDIVDLRDRLVAKGYDVPINMHVALDAPEDRWICLPPYGPDDPVHLKILLRGSVSTSIGLTIRKPG